MMTTKFLFAFFIANEGGNEDPFDQFENVFDKKTPEQNAATVKQKSREELVRLEQFGHYWDEINERIVFLGVADSKGVVNVIDGEAKLTVFGPNDPSNNRGTEANKFMRAICEDIGLDHLKDRCTWIVVPLDELASGHGTLFVEGMAGESGGG